MKNNNWQPSILFNSAFIDDIENEGNISAFYTLFIKEDPSKTNRLTIDSNDGETIINSNDDIFSIINNTIFEEKSSSMSTIKQVRSEIVNENLLAINITRDVSGVNGGEFIYSDYYWLVVLYKKDGETALEKQGDEIKVKKDYIHQIKSGYGINKEYSFKIGFIMNLPNVGEIKLNPRVENIFYLPLDPFNVNVKFDGINKPTDGEDNKDSLYVNQEFTKAFNNPLYNHFHETFDIGGNKPMEKASFSTRYIVESAKEQGRRVDYFNTVDEKEYETEESNPCLAILEENVGIRTNDPKIIKENIFKRSSDQNNVHKEESKNKSFFYSQEEKEVFDLSRFPSSSFFNTENTIELLVDLRRVTGKEKKVEILLNTVNDEDILVVCWDFIEGTEPDNQNIEGINQSNKKISHYYNEIDKDFVFIRITGNIGKIFLDDESIVNANIIGLALNSGVSDNNLSQAKKNSTIKKLIVNKIGGSFRMKLSDFKSLIYFSDNTNDKFGFDEIESNEYFADKDSSNLNEYKKVNYRNIKSAKNLFNGWTKLGSLELNTEKEAVNFDNSFSNMINITNASINLNGSTEDKKEISFIETFKNNEKLLSVNIQGLKDNNISVKTIEGLFEDSKKLVTVKIGDSDKTENYINFNSHSELNFNRAFKNTKNLEDIKFGDDVNPLSMSECFNGSGINEFYFLKEDNICKDFSKAFSNCKNIKILGLNLRKAEDISDLLLGSSSEKEFSLLIENSSVPLVFDIVQNNVLNEEYKYSLGVNPNIFATPGTEQYKDGVVNISFNKDYFKNIKTPHLKIGDGYSRSVIAEILKPENLFHSFDSFNFNCLYNIVDVTKSNHKKDISQIIPNGGYNHAYQFDASSGDISQITSNDGCNVYWHVYDNSKIGDFIYINNQNSINTRNGYNWNILYPQKDKEINISLGGSDLSALKHFSGESSKYLVSIENLSKEEEYAISIEDHTENCIDGLSFNSLFFERIRKLGAIDLLFGGTYSNNNNITIKISPNEIKPFSISFLVNVFKHKERKTSGNSKISLLTSRNSKKKSSKDVEFLRFIDQSNNKIDVRKLNDELFYENIDDSIEFSSKDVEIITFNLNSLSTSSEAIFSIAGDCTVNGIIISNPEDIKEIP